MARTPRSVQEALLAQSPSGLDPSSDHASHSPIPRLPTGTLTFCFTDIEGSTQLWEQHPQAMPLALARHDAILRAAIQAHDGIVFKTVGDGVHAVFAHARGALEAALAAQHLLSIEPWDEFVRANSPQSEIQHSTSKIELRVRIALHTGVAELRDGDYFGPPLNRVARILMLGHGGQTLLSHATHDLVADDLPAQIALQDLGEYPLKDLSRPEYLFQVDTPDLPANFPPLRTQKIQSSRSQSAASPLLATKLYIPALRPQLVSRPRLVERVQTGLLGKLTLIAAPAGFGKTTLLSAWLATRTAARGLRTEADSFDHQSSANNPAVAWVSLDADDNDPIRFWRYVTAALETIYPAIGTTTDALLQSSQPPPMDAVVTCLINAITPIALDAVLVLDDYHLITTPAIHAAITFLLDHLPAHLHLVMLTRADPPLPLTRLRSRGELTELRASDLRFTADEATTFLTVMMGLRLTNDQVTALETRTEGWAAGLQLAALAMQNRANHASFVAAFSGSNRFVVDYLVEEVLARQPPHLQMFLTQTAILDRMCGPLCDAVLGVASDQLQVTRSEADPLVTRHSSLVTQASYSQLILDQLERANLFLIPLDDERQWYRYHHLFADVLRARLYSGATANEVAALHQRASAWYEQAGLIGEAVRSAFLVHDSERAVFLVEQYAMTILLDSSDLFLVRAWVEQLPRALILVRPRLTLIAGITLALMGQFDTVEQLLMDAAPAFSAPDISPNSLGELATLRSTVVRFRRDAPSTLTLAQHALAQLALDNYVFRAVATLNMGVAFIWRGEIAAAKVALADAAALSEAGGNQWIGLSALEELSSLYARHGQLRQVLRISEQAAQLSTRMGGRPIPAAGVSHVGSAEVFYEWNDLARATHAATQAIDLLQGTVERLLLVRGYIVLAQMHQAQADHAAALDAVQRCEEWFVQTPIAATSIALAWLAAYQARLWVRQGDLAAANRWAQECAFADDSELGYVQQLTLVQLHLAQSHNSSGGLLLGEASAVLAKLLPAVEARGWTRYLIEGLVLQALVSQTQMNRTSALRALERALSLAAPEGYVRIFADEGAPMRLLIADCRSQIIQRDPNAASNNRQRFLAYVDTVLAAFPGSGTATRALQSPISDRALPSLPASQPPRLVEPLSARELEILRLIADGHSNQAIADTLIIAVSTVKRHINNIYGKLDVQSRTQALARARELRLL
ncbi:MAG: LuxR C-terminal-related transcriptional regulator [Roseiflexaceae bacterium]